jgi:hypothetical protein
MTDEIIEFTPVECHLGPRYSTIHKELARFYFDNLAEVEKVLEFLKARGAAVGKITVDVDEERVQWVLYQTFEILQR